MNNKQNIIVSNYDSIFNPHYSGGGAAAVHEMCKRLAKTHVVKVIAGTFEGAQAQEVDGVRYTFVGSNMLGPKLGHLFYQAALLFKAGTEKYDLWIEGSSPPVTFSLLPLRAKSKVVSWIHMFAGSDMHRKYKLPFQSIEKFLAKNYRYFIVLSDWAKNKVQKDLDRKQVRIGVIPNGVVVASGESWERPLREKYFLFLGRLEIDQKGLDLLLLAFKAMKDKSDVRLKIAGKGSEKELAAVKTMIKDNDLSKRVEILGKVGGEEKEKLLADCLALVLPSRFDTYPLVVLEAFAHAKPVVLFDLPQLSWLPGNASIKAECFQVDAYAKALASIIENEQARQEMGRDAREFAKNNTWDNVYDKFLGFVESI